jgi:hypothetical protein
MGHNQTIGIIAHNPERDFRLEWVEKIGLGCDLPAPIWATAHRPESRLNEKMVDETGVEPVTSSLRTM